MTHSDDDGLVLPPKLAPQQVVIIPIVKDDSAAGALIEFAAKVAARLKEKGVRVHVDSSDARAPDKMWGAIKRGVPIRVEIGAREMEVNSLTFVRRDLGRDSKKTVTVDEFVGQVSSVLEDIHQTLYKRAFDTSRSRVQDVKTVAEIKEFYTSGRQGYVKAPVALLQDQSYEAVKKDNSLSSRCLPFEDEGQKVLIGKSY